jgi:hypothetical protein
MASLLTSPLAEEEAQQALKQASNDLIYLFDSFKIPQDVTAKVVSLGYLDVEIWSKIDDSREAVRAAIKHDLGIDPAKGGAHRGLMARLLACWETASKRSEVQKREEAEQHVSGMPRTLKHSQHLELRNAYAAAFQPLEEKECLAPGLIEAKLEQLEDGELLVESLQDIVSKERSNSEGSQEIRIDSDGRIKVRKGKVTGSPPQDPEELRQKLRLIGRMWSFVKLQHPNRSFLSDYNEQAWADYADWLLGEKKVWRYEIKSSDSNYSHRASWNTLLSLDFQVRKYAYQLVFAKDISLNKALKEP